MKKLSSMAEIGAIRRCDIIVIDQIKSIRVILDPTQIRFKISSDQPEHVNK